jgi:hypothetical protein
MACAAALASIEAIEAKRRDYLRMPCIVYDRAYKLYIALYDAVKALYPECGEISRMERGHSNLSF